MSTRKKIAKKNTNNTVPETKVVFSPERELSISVKTSLQYGVAGMELTFKERIEDGVDPMEAMDSRINDITEELCEKFNILCEKLGVSRESTETVDIEDIEENDIDDTDEPDINEDDIEDIEEDNIDDDIDEDEEDDTDEDEEDDIDEDELTVDDIQSMKKAELAELIKEERLDINPKGMPVAKLRDAVVDALFEESEWDDEEWADEEWDDEE